MSYLLILKICPGGIEGDRSIGKLRLVRVWTVIVCIVTNSLYALQQEMESEYCANK